MDPSHFSISGDFVQNSRDYVEMSANTPIDLSKSELEATDHEKLVVMYMKLMKLFLKRHTTPES